ncbi:MAG TPA: site-2 protease family protein, partial [Acidobacteriota bacterium]|nr:site-2 protease family protein [Acidobacteriota bacterium]
ARLLQPQALSPGSFSPTSSAPSPQPDILQPDILQPDVFKSGFSMLSHLRPTEISRPFGIPVLLDPSWYVIFVVYLWLIGWVYLPGLVPGLPMVTYLGFGLLTALLFFLSILIHELAHSLVARAEGVGIHNITLYVFGGLAHLTGEPASPGAEFRIAAAGPAASCVLGVMFLVAEWLLQQIAHRAVATQICHYLGWLNVILAGFNLIPGFPLDGGRIVRAGLWWRQGSFHQATLQVMRFSLWIANVLMVVGGALFFLRWNLGLSIVVTGAFMRILTLRSLPRSPESSVKPVSPSARCGPIAQDAIATQLVSVTPDTSIAAVMAQVQAQPPLVVFPVISQRRLHGIVQTSRLQAVPAEVWETTQVRDVMEPVHHALFIDRQAPLAELEHLVLTNQIGHAAILDGDGYVIGFVSLRDVKRAMSR